MLIHSGADALMHRICYARHSQDFPQCVIRQTPNPISRDWPELTALNDRKMPCPRFVLQCCDRIGVLMRHIAPRRIADDSEFFPLPVQQLDFVTPWMHAERACRVDSSSPMMRHDSPTLPPMN